MPKVYLIGPHMRDLGYLIEFHSGILLYMAVDGHRSHFFCICQKEVPYFFTGLFKKTLRADNLFRTHCRELLCCQVIELYWDYFGSWFGLMHLMQQHISVNRILVVFRCFRWGENTPSRQSKYPTKMEDYTCL